MSLSLRYVASRQWAILEEYLSLMTAIADRDLDTQQVAVQAIEREFGQPIPGTQEASLRGNIAIIPIAGPMFRYANLFTQISGAMSYERLATDIGTVMSDPTVERVIFDVNSPGGEVDGAAEVADLIASFRGVKPITSYISHLGASAGYWLAAAADEVVVHDTSIVGSIGAVLSLVDYSKQDEERGIQRMELVSSQSPDKRVDPFSEDKGEAERAKLILQGLVDRLGAVFIEKVSGFRGISDEEIMATKGGLLIGSDAVEAGLADRVGTLEGLIEQFSGADTDIGTVHMSLAAEASSTTTMGEASMEGSTQTNPAAEAPEITREEALAYLRAEHPDVIAEIMAQGATEERDRVLGIYGLEASGFEPLRDELMADPTITKGEAALKILSAKGEAEKRRAQAVADGLEADEGDLEGVSSASLPETEEDTEEALAASVVQYL